jgi:hypothetical protein
MGWAAGISGGRGGVLPPPPDPGWINLLDQDFNSVALGDPAPGASLNAAMGNSGGSGTLPSFAFITHNGGRAFRWRSPLNTYSSSGGTNGLAAFYRQVLDTYAAVNGLILEAAIQYDVTYPLNMSWSKGWKEPGLGGSSTAANPPTGGAGPLATGWSGRSMQLGPGAGTFFGRKAIAPSEWVGYFYGMGQAHPGENFWTSCVPEAGNTYTKRIEYKMNDIGVSNGEWRMYWDGDLVFERTDLLYRTSALVGINVHLQHYFRGGNDVSWVGAVTNDIIFDNFKIEVPSP